MSYVKMRAAGAVLATISACSIFFASPASAAEYDGVNPDTSSCNNTATTVKSASVANYQGVKVGTVELRYSTACRTVWVRTIGPVATADGSGMVGYVVRNSDGKTYGADYRSGTTKWSKMLNDVGVTSYAKAFDDNGEGAGATARTGNY